MKNKAAVRAPTESRPVWAGPPKKSPAAASGAQFKLPNAAV